MGIRIKSKNLIYLLFPKNSHLSDYCAKSILFFFLCLFSVDFELEDVKLWPLFKTPVV